MSLKESRVAAPQKHSHSTGRLSGLLPFIFLKAFCVNQPQVRLESPVNSQESPAIQLPFKRTSGQSWQEWPVQSVQHPVVSATRDPERNVKIRSNQTPHPLRFRGTSQTIPRTVPTSVLLSRLRFSNTTFLYLGVILY